MKSFLYGVARRTYHRLPLSQAMKWRLRERLRPLLTYLQGSSGMRALVSAVAESIAPSDMAAGAGRSVVREGALVAMLGAIEAHARAHGVARHWLALPFLSTGGAEMATLNFCRAIRSLCPQEGVVLLVTDRDLISELMQMPDGVQLLVFDEYLGEDRSYATKQALLMELLIAASPAVFHNVNSEVAWHLILEQGERLKRYTALFASIFAFQYLPNSRQKVGYAASFLERGLPHLAGLVTDNQRFVHDAVAEYGLVPAEAAKLQVVYQPCRLRDAPGEALQQTAPEAGQRPRILWAGRLDAEKRVDLFLDVVRACDFCDFHVFGRVVLEGADALPALPNLHYEGPFSSPREWLARGPFAAFLFTSRWEGMPNILVEAGFLGLAVIAPSVGGVAELVSDDTGYLLAEDPSVQDYVRVLRQIQADPKQAVERAQKLHRLVTGRHGWERFVASTGAIAGYFPPADRPSSHAAAGGADLPLVSVVVPCFNQGRYLAQSVASALQSSSAPLEVIIVDDGSTDLRIGQWLEEAVALAPGVVRVHRQANAGLSAARNSGLALCRGEFVQFLDADDLLTPGKLDAQLAQLRLRPDAGVSVCNFLLSDETVSVFSKPEEAIARFDLGLDDFLYRWERGFAIPIHCGLFRRATLEAHGGFDTAARAKEDWLFWTGLVLGGVRLAYVHGHWAIYRQHEGSMRRSYVNMGRSWLDAGLRLDARLAGREPLFFESVVSWFEQCYRSSDQYRKEISELTAAQRLPAAATALPGSPATGPEELATVKPAELLQRLDFLSTNDRPMITVIVPIHGHYRYLRECLWSLGDQGDVVFEVICIDDASSDVRVPALLDGLRGHLPGLNIRLLPRNIGISAVQNMAVELARGDYVAFLDCDDALEARALQTVAELLRVSPEIDYLFTDRKDVDEAGTVLRVARYGGYESIDFSTQGRIREDLLDGMVASHLKVIRRSAYQNVGGTDDRFSGVQDWELALKIAEKHRLHYLAQALYRHRIHSGSVTRSDRVAQFRKTNEVRRRFSCQRYPRAGAGQQSVRVFSLADFPVPLDAFKRVWQEGGLCWVDATGPFHLAQVNALREFNSYVDRIVWDDPAVPVALYGYLHEDLELVRSAAVEPGAGG